MRSFPGYTTIAELREGAKTIVYRGVRAHDGQPVILKALKAQYPDMNDVAQLKREFDITNMLGVDGIVKTYTLEQYGHDTVLVLEDFGGVPLNSLLADGPLGIDTFLSFAIQLADILGHVHSANIVHKDVKPSNILINTTTGQVKLGDFGIAARLVGDDQSFRATTMLEGTLVYVSPEQTGRMNRPIDYRSDFYSLGVTFYEMLTGQVPFPATDPMELVHAHIAVQPRLPVEHNPAVPPALAALVLKLIAKMAEERYQSAYGLKADLEKCRRQWQERGAIADFPLGQHDSANRFRIPQKLYGRTTEIERMHHILSSVQQGAAAVTLVSGQTGVGKSALANELHKRVVQTRGYFISGKFDQLQRAIPYSAIIQAFQGLVQQLMTESEIQIEQWRTQLLTVLGVNAQVIIDVLPEIELIIGVQNPVADLPSTEAQNRFNIVFQNFVQVFAHPEHPLVIFLDDLQWADAASMRLITLLLATPETHALLLIGTYRTDEVSPHHPLMLGLDTLRETGIPIHHIALPTLDETSVSQLVADTLGCPVEASAPLARLIHQKTDGSPLFVTEFLRSLYETELVRFDPTQGWQWEIATIQQMQATNNVIEFMLRKLSRLLSATRHVLQLAASIGNRFDLPILATVYQQTPEATLDDLAEALQEHLIMMVDDHYEFQHDRIQEAAYALIPDAEKQSIHYQIGHLLLHQTSADALADHVFAIVKHLNLASALITTATERDQLVRLNLLASQRAKAAAAYGAALAYCKAGIQMLAAHSWQTAYDLTLTIYVEATEAAFMSADFAASSDLAQQVLQHATNLLDQVKVYELQMQSYIAQNQMSKAVETGLKVLEMLGVTLINWGDADLTLPDLDAMTHMPQMRSPEHQAAMRILVTLAPPAIQTSAQIYPRGILTQIRYCLAYGHTDLSAVSYGLYGCVLVAGQPQDLAAGYHAGQLALRLLEHVNAQHLKSKVYNLFNAHIQHWHAHINTTTRPLREGIQSGLDHGDLQFVGYNAKDLCVHLFFLGEPLEQLERQQAQYIRLLQNLKQEHATYHIRIWHQAVLNLLGRSASHTQLQGDSCTAATLRPQLEAANNHILLFNTYLAEALLHYMFGDYTGALALAEQADVYTRAAAGKIGVGMHTVLLSLAMLAHYPRVSAQTQTQYLARVAQNQERIRRWSPANYQHYHDLIEAEQARVRGQTERAMEYYDRAIAAALEQSFLLAGGLANERAAEFYLTLGRQRIAQMYLRDGHYCYTLWGADAKLADLEERYAHLLDSRPTATGRRDDIQTAQRTATSSVTTSSSTSGQTLDLITVIKATQALSGEMVLSHLLEKLIGTVIENAGAQKGVLLLDQASQLVIEMVGTVEDQRICVSPALPLDAHMQLAFTVINYVKRSGQSLVVTDAQSDHRFAQDQYIMAQQPKSILCVPILNKGKLTGILYLENNLTDDAFTAERIEMMQIVAAQAAISMENARLYEEMDREMRERKRAEEALRSIAMGTATVTGGDFFRSLVRYLAAAFDVRIVFVTECTDTTMTRVRTITFLNNQSFSENFEYDLVGTPCEKVVGGEVCYYPANLAELFPDKKETGLESFLGAPLYDSRGTILGHLAVFDDKPMQRTDYDMAILRIFAARAGTELERQRAEETLHQNEEHLRQLNEQLEDYSRNLEQKVIQRTHEIERRRQVAERLRDMLAILNSNRSLQDILDYIVAEGIGLLDTQSGAIYQLDADQSMLVVQAARGLPPEYVDKLAFPMDRSFLGAAMTSRKPVIISDLATAVRDRDIGIDARRQQLLIDHYQMLMAVPLIRQGDSAETDEMYGGIALYYPNPKQFSEEEINLAVAFADQAALAIENARLRQQVKQAAVTEERGRLARELHDSVTQSLYSLTLLAEGWRRMAGTGQLDNIAEILAELGSIGQQALKEMRLLVHQLRPPVLEKEGLWGALHHRLAAVEQRAGVEARLVSDEVIDLPAPIEEGLYRIAQEALNNALKHAHATSVGVHIRTGKNHIELEVVDDGQGFDPALATDQGGIGMNSMRERAEDLGGSLTISSAAEQGTRVKVSVQFDTTDEGIQRDVSA